MSVTYPDSINLRPSAVQKATCELTLRSCAQCARNWLHLAKLFLTTTSIPSFSAPFHLLSTLTLAVSMPRSTFSDRRSPLRSSWRGFPRSLICKSYVADHRGGSSRKSDDNAAFYSGSSGKRKERRAAGGSRSRVKCHNCDKIGHFKADCWAPGGGKEGKGPRGKGKEKEKEKEKDTAASARSKDTADAAWMALSALTDSDSEFEELTYSSDSDAISFEDFLDPVELLLDTSIAPENPRGPLGRYARPLLCREQRRRG